MEFTEEHARRLLAKEWLAKNDSGLFIPYLFKFDCSLVDLSCCVLLTDTKSVWTEVLSSQQLARRWRSLNPPSSEPMSKAAEEDAWREQILELLSNAHTIGGTAELNFQLVESNYSDFAFELECEAFKWRWETTFLGHKLSSEIISKHLIFPLISLNHLTFSLTEAVGELPDAELEKAIDKLGRTARRTVDTHVKNAFSKPRVATTVRRMTAMFNFVSDLPPVTSTAEKPQLHARQLQPETTIPAPKLAKRLRDEENRESSPKPVPERRPDKLESITTTKTKAVQSDSATESEGESMNISKPRSLENVAGPSKNNTASEEPEQMTRTPPIAIKPTESTSDLESPLHRPVKKAKSKALTSSDEESEGERKKLVKSGNTGASKTRGTRQPIKRGGKRF